MRPGFRPTPGHRTRQPGRDAARARKNAAEPRSPGTRNPNGSSGPGCTVTSAPFNTTSTPHMRSIRSVWSRVGIGSMTVVRSAAASPARRIADFTCALATGDCQDTPSRTGLPWTRRGAVPSGDASTSAPMARSGSTTRVIGRRRNDAIAVQRRLDVVAGQHARKQPHGRPRVGAVEHRLGARNRPTPLPSSAYRAGGKSRTQTPQARRHAAVASTSAAGDALPMYVRP